jgi:O-antigen/teichoic acid export membrane protein
MCYVPDNRASAAKLATFGRPAAAPAPALGRAVGRGMSLTAANSIFAKVLSFAAVAILGWLLDRHDFGLYAMAFSIAAFLQIFRDGGVVQLLVQRGEESYESLLGPVFWMGLAFNSGTALVLSCIAPAAASFKGEPMLAPLIWLLALTLPLGTPAAILTARLQMQMRFGCINAVSLGSSLIRYGGTIALAIAGCGPLSFVIPMPVIAVYEGVAYYLTVRESPWRCAARVRAWPALFAHSKWLIFFSLSVATLNQGGYLVISAIVDVEKIGVFAFAFQLISQVDALLGTLGGVLFPALARLNADPARQANATMRTIRVLMFLACPAAIGLASIARPLEQLLWHGRWHDVVWPVRALALFYGARILITIPNAALQARGMFRPNAVLTLLAGLGIMAAAGIGAAWGKHGANPDHDTPYRIAECMGIAIGVCCTGVSLWGLSRLGLEWRRVLGAIAPSWIFAVVAGVVTIGVERYVRVSFDAFADTIVNRLRTHGVSIANVEWAPTAIDAFLRLTIAFALYCAAYGLFQRLFAMARLSEAIAVAPGPLRRLATRVALLRTE